MRKTAIGRDMATKVTTKLVMAMGQNVATKKGTAMGQDGATKVEGGLGGAHRGAHRGLGRATATARREEVTRQMETTLGHEVRRFPKGRVHAPAAECVGLARGIAQMLSQLLHKHIRLSCKVM